jgi:uncharacterized protein YciI
MEIHMRIPFPAIPCLCVALLAPTLVLEDQQTPPPKDAQAATSALEQVSWLVGGTWVARSAGPSGVPEETHARFSWADHGEAITYRIDKHTSAGAQPNFVGTCYLDPETDRITWVEIDHEGSVTRSELARVEGDRLFLEETTTPRDGKKFAVRAEVTREGEHGFSFVASVERGGAWTPVFRADYERAETATDPAPPCSAWLATLRLGPGFDRSKVVAQQASFGDHVRAMEQLASEGVLLIGGPLLQTPDRETPAGAMVVLEARNEGEARAVLGRDPFVRSSVLEITSVQPMLVAGGAWLPVHRQAR